MKLLFDLLPTQEQLASVVSSNTGVFHGGGEYTKSIYYRILEQRENVQIDAYYEPARELDKVLLQASTSAGVNLIPISYPYDVQNILDSGNYDRFFSGLPKASYAQVDYKQTEVIFTFHGLRGVEMPTDKYEYRFETSLRGKIGVFLKQAFLDLYIREQIKRRQKLMNVKTSKFTILTDSYHSKYTHVVYFSTKAKDNLLILYPPPSPISRIIPRAERLQDYGLKSREYILLVSGDRWIKNGYRAAKALDELIEQGSLEKHIVIAGVPNSQIYNVKHKHQFTFLSYVDQEDLAALYQGAYCLLYPSLNEGFGYPPLECMRFGTPVIASSISSIPEVCGDASLYVNPFSILEIQTRLLYLLFEPDVWIDYSQRAQNRYATIVALQEKMLVEITNLLIQREFGISNQPTTKSV
jgi:glycosyltransferase involved in cell wall biosynthesis